MRKFLKLSATLVVFAPLSVLPVFAQTAPLSPVAIAAQCSAVPIECGALVRAQIAALRAQGLAPADLNVALTNIVNALAVDTTIPAAVSSAAIREIVPEISDPEVAQQVAAIADAVETGDTVETAALGNPASPN